jgi:rhodanese-related sulfurtransferase
MQHLTPTEAYAYLKAHPQALFVDCRSEAEYFLVGHPLVDRTGDEPWRPENICWADELKLEVNAEFVAQIRARAPLPDCPIVIICRSGRRSVFAAEALEAAGYSDVYNVLDGFEGPLDENFQRGTRSGWRRAGLPWEQL